MGYSGTSVPAVAAIVVEEREQTVSDSTPCYVGVAPEPCHHWVAAMVDDPATRAPRARDHAKELVHWVRRGLTIERHTVAEVRENLNSCDMCCPIRHKVRSRARHVGQGSLL